MHAKPDETTSFTVSLPEPLRAFVAERVAGRFRSPSDYIRELIQEDQQRAEQDKLEALLIQGIDSGDPIKVAPEFWDEKRKHLRARHGPKNGS